MATRGMGGDELTTTKRTGPGIPEEAQGTQGDQGGHIDGDGEEGPPPPPHKTRGAGPGTPREDQGTWAAGTTMST